MLLRRGEILRYGFTTDYIYCELLSPHNNCISNPVYNKQPTTQKFGYRQAIRTVQVNFTQNP